MTADRKKTFAVVLMTVAVLLILGIILGSMYIVHQNEYGIVWQFGAVRSVKDQPGLYLKVPFNQSETTLPKTELLYDLPISDVITGDKHSMVLIHLLSGVSATRGCLLNLFRAVSQMQRAVLMLSYTTRSKRLFPHRIRKLSFPAVTGRWSGWL